MSIEIRNLTKRLGGKTILDRVSLDIPEGSLMALLGPSGSGKTTLLRIVAGLEHPDEGEVLVRGEASTAQRPQDRHVGFVFQHYALFPHMSVRQNVAFGLEVKPRAQRPSREVIRARVSELLELIQMDSYGSRLPSELSGGQRQRVALARALAVEPRVLLLDEPFGALDAQVRAELRQWLRRLHDVSKVTTVLVTHDQEEAMEVADTVAVMNKARVEQVGHPRDIYDHPASAFVAQFVGQMNRLHQVEDGTAFARPHEMELSLDASEGEAAQVVKLVSVGPMARLRLSLSGDRELDVHLTRERLAQLPIAEGDRVFVRPGRVSIFADDYSI
jgi:sulfate/thiosulfate transport system ATP-binding protein